MLMTTLSSAMAYVFQAFLTVTFLILNWQACITWELPWSIVLIVSESVLFFVWLNWAVNYTGASVWDDEKAWEARKLACRKSQADRELDMTMERWDENERRRASGEDD